MKWTSDKDKYLRSLVQNHGTKWTKIAKEMSNHFHEVFNKEQVRSRWRTYLQHEQLPPEDTYKSQIEINSDGSHKSDRLLRMSEEQSKDVNYLLDAHGYDRNEWELVSARNNIWNVYSKQDGIQTLYSSKITVRPKKEEFTVEDIKAFFEDLSKHYKSPVHKPTNYSKDGKILEINIADLHLGKLCWVGDSNDHYNEKVAQERFNYILSDILTRTREYKFEKIIFMWSNDFFHYDTINKTTTAGTPQDTNLQWQQMFKMGVEMLVKGIDLISKFAPVDTMYIGSNHDKMFSYFATEYLYAWYKDNPNVTVDNEARSRKFRKFGNVLIGYTHGHQEKKRIGDWLQVEARKEWGETVYHYVHAAHIHSEKEIEEKNGVIIHYVSSPTGTDKWHYDSAYGAVKKAQSFIYDKKFGLIETKNTPIKP